MANDWQERWQEASQGLKHLREDRGATVYEVRRVELKNGAFITERRVTTEGYSERVVWESKWQPKEQWDCFCCTCDDYNDAACRNHGFYGKRPCETHNTSGYPGEDSDKLPDSVQVYRAKEAAKAASEG